MGIRRGWSGPYRRGYLSHEFRQRQPHHRPGRHRSLHRPQRRVPARRRAGRRPPTPASCWGWTASWPSAATAPSGARWLCPPDCGRGTAAVWRAGYHRQRHRLLRLYHRLRYRLPTPPWSASTSLRDTMQSHERCSVVEVMGRHAGYLALYVGVAVGATAVLVPEHQYDFEKHVAEKIRAGPVGGQNPLHGRGGRGCRQRHGYRQGASKSIWGLTPVSPFWATSSGAAVPPPRTV